MDPDFPTAETVGFQSLGLGVVRNLFCPAQKPEPGTLEPCNLLLGCKAGLISSTKEFIDRDSYESLADVVEPFHGCKTTGACVWGGVISACRKAWRIATYLFSRLSCTTQPDAAGALECLKPVNRMV